MLAKLEVRYHGVKVGTLVQRQAGGGIFFQFDPHWQSKGLELSPIHLPTHASGALGNPDPELGGLHGLFWDSIPDAWGNRLLDAQLVKAGIDPERCSSLVRLAYIGDRAMGALEYVPTLGDTASAKAVELALLDRDAQRILDDDVVDPNQTGNYLALIQGGASAGGAKPKVCVGLDSQRSMHIGSNLQMPQWLVKLSALPSTHKDSKQQGVVEHAYALMAAACGIQTPETRVFKGITDRGKDRWFFATKRFDRKPDGARVHVHSLAGVLQLHHGSQLHTYEGLMVAAQQLIGTVQSKDEIFRRLVFNVLACNRDDHARNWAFVMKESGEWDLSPAYDLTASDGPNRAGVHCLSVNGSRLPDGKDIAAFASQFGISNARELFEQVQEGVSRWMEFASIAGLRNAMALRVHEGMKAQLDDVRFPAIPQKRKWKR